MKQVLSGLAALVIVILASLGYIELPETSNTNNQAPAPTSEQAELTLKDFGSASDPASTHTAQQAPALPNNKWSSHDPAINQHHIFYGEINRRGKPVGYHSRPQGQDPESARLIRVQDTPNSAGIYTARIEIYDPEEQRWKDKFSSFFPDAWSSQQVLEAIDHAYDNRQSGQSRPWRGPSGHGFLIEGYTLSGGDINTAFPVYQP